MNKLPGVACHRSNSWRILLTLVMGEEQSDGAGRHTTQRRVCPAGQDDGDSCPNDNPSPAGIGQVLKLLCANETSGLVSLKNEYLEQDGVRFLMADTEGSTVACSVSHDALRDYAERAHLSGTDAAVFEAYRELIEQVASDVYDAEGPFDSEALARVTRSA